MAGNIYDCFSFVSNQGDKAMKQSVASIWGERMPFWASKRILGMETKETKKKAHKAVHLPYKVSRTHFLDRWTGTREDPGLILGI